MKTMFARIGGRLRALLHPARVDAEMEEELRFHLELEIADRERRGMPPQEARRSALADFGGLEATRERGRDARGVRWIHDIGRDVHYGLQALRRTPLFTVTTALTMALGVAATTAVVSGVNALLVRPLPVSDPGRLFIWTEHWQSSMSSTSTSMALPTYAWEHFRDVADATHDVLAGVGAFGYQTFSLRSGDEARMLFGVVASADYFRVLGVTPALGSFFTARDESAASATPEVVVSHDYWMRELGGRPDAIGETLWLDSRPLTLVGVTPAGFQGTVLGLAAQVWIPAAVYRLPPPSSAGGVQGTVRDPRLTIFGRLPPGTTRPRAEAALSAIGPHLPAAEDWQRIRRVQLVPMTAMPAMSRGSFAAFMGLLGATALLVLLIAATNVTGMLLARATHRRHEIAVRMALGAGRWRVARQLLVESALAGAAGAGLGILFTAWAVRLASFRAGSFAASLGVHTSLDLTPDRGALALAIGIGLAACLAAGVLPALRSTRLDMLPALRGEGERVVRRGRGLRGHFVVAQVAMSLTLLVAAGLFVRALQHSLHVDPGFDPDGVLAAGISLGPHGYDQARGEAFYAELTRRMRARPEFGAIGLGRSIPLAGAYSGEGIRIPGAGDGRRLPVGYAVVDTGFLRTLRIPLRAGRWLSSADAAGGPPVAVINETLAHALAPDGMALGHSFRLAGRDRQVVGIVANGKYRSLGESPVAFAFLPVAQDYGSSLLVLTRVRGSFGAAEAALRTVVAGLDPNVALEQPHPLVQNVDLWRIPQRIAAFFIGGFGLAGLLLAAIGIYGVLAYHVSRRTREFGVRLALGATARQLTGQVLHEGLIITAIGSAVGLAAAVLVARPMSRFLYGIDAFDPVTFTGVPLLIGAIALIAAYLPARRAAHVDPMVSLRSE